MTLFDAVTFVRAAALRPDSASVTVADEIGVQLTDLRSGSPPVDLVGQAGRVHALAFAADGSHVVAGADGEVVVWAATGELVRTLPGPEDQMRCVAIGRRGGLVAAAGERGDLVIWDVASGQQQVRLTADEISREDRRSVIRSLGFDASSRRLVMTLHSGSILVWDTQTQATAEVVRRGEGGRPVRGLAIGPSGQIAAGDNRGSVYLPAETGAGLREVAGHVGAVTAVAFSSDGRVVATGGDDRTVRLWDVVSGRLLQVLRGLNGQIMAIRFSTDAAEVVACDGDAVVASWSVGEGRLRERLRCRRPTQEAAGHQPGLRAWQMEAMRNDWESIRCGCPRGARHVPGSFAQLVRARNEHEARAHGLVNDVEIQGMLFEAAVPVTSMIIAALEEADLSVPARQRLLDLLATFVDGESYHSEALEGRPQLERACRQRAREGRAVLERELREETVPGGAALVAEILESIDE